MKKVFLHGELGKEFGREWNLDVKSASEALSALFANNSSIEVYLNKKQQDDVFYGVRSGRSKSFLTSEEMSARTNEDFHLFPIPLGSGGAVVGLLVTAATTAASMYVSKKMAEAMQREDKTVKAQTQSFLFNGSENRYEQGATVPLGYGRMKVGSNTISACNVNYDYDSDKGDIFNFTSGLYSLIPTYSKYYNDEYGPLGSSFHVNQFDGSSKFKTADPAYLFLKTAPSLNTFGSNDGSYGQYEDAAAQQDRYVTQGSKNGNALGGYMYYEYNYFKGLNKSLLGNAQANGNWFQDSNILDNTLAVSSAAAIKSSLVCLQSSPIAGNEEKVFYPIMFADSELTSARNPIDRNDQGFAPIQVGERWKGADKNNGVGWFKLESASVYKAVDLVCEGPIDGFSDNNGDTLKFRKELERNDDPALMRNSMDDYLQGVYLNDDQAKEVNHATNLDSYNINEFDIDIGMNKDGLIGSNDQSLLEPQYLFTANTKDINAPLYGPRSINQEAIITEQSDIGPFKQNKTYKLGELVSYQDDGQSYNYKLSNSLSNKFSKNEDYNYAADNVKIVYEENGDSKTFYAATQLINEYNTFDGGYVDIENDNYYLPGDKIKSESFLGGVEYYEMGPDSEKFLGVFDYKKTYAGLNGYVIMKSQGDVNSTSPIYKITGDYNPAENDSIGEFAKLLMHKYRDENNQEKIVSNDPIYILKNTEDEDLAGNRIIGDEQDITPSTSNLWQSIVITSPQDEVKNGPIGPGSQGDEYDGDLNLFKFANNDTVELVKSQEEEYYVAHSIINPLVEEVYVSLQIDELAYLYEGDELNVTYKPGALMGALFGLMIVAEEATAVAGGIAAAIGLPTEPGAKVMGGKEMAKALVKIAAVMALGAILGNNTKFKIGTKVENSGETWPNRARFRIKYGNQGESQYSTDVYIYGVATSPYRKDVKIYLPPNPSAKDRSIKVYKLNRERNPVKEGEQSARYKEKMLLAGITEISPVQLSYPNSVVIGTRINAKDVPSIPKRNYNLKLKKLAIPSNYNPDTRIYDGSWNGLFRGQSSSSDQVPDAAKEWTDNPAWCLYDLISSKRYGVGKFGVKPENIDRWTLYRIAKYCDEFVPTGYSSKYKQRAFKLYGDRTIKIDPTENLDIAKFNKEFNHPNKRLAIYYDNNKYESIKINGTSNSGNEVRLEINPSLDFGKCAVEIDYPLVEPRYTINAFLMNSDNAFKLINEFAAIFRAFAYWSGGAINFFQDEKKDSVMLFANNNISKDGFSYSNTPKTSRTNSCKIKYVDRFNNFKSKIEYSEERASVQKNGIIEQTIDGFGITSQGQAKRAADFVVKSANMESEILSFTTSSIGSYLKPGDVIDVLDNKRTIGRFAGKITDISIYGDGKSAEISIDYPINAIIEKDEKDTWKNITLYNISGNETIKSLDEKIKPSDQEISNMRSSQIKTFTAASLYGDDQKLLLVSNPYSFISGEYTWREAKEDALDRGGRLATITNDTDQLLMQSTIESGQTGWIGGYFIDLPPPPRFIWDQPEACNTDEISFYSWAEGFPKIGDSLQDHEDQTIVTDCDEFEIMTDPPDGFGNFIAASGSEDNSINGDWVTLSGVSKIGYILERESDDSLFSLKDVKGSTFMMEDSVNLAKPKQFKVVNITESSNGIFEVRGLEYNKEKFDNIEKNMSIKHPESPVIFTESVLDAPSEITIEILSEDVSRKIPYGLKLSWNTVLSAASYKIQFFNGNILISTFEIPNDKGVEVNSYSYRNETIKEDGNYYGRVYSVVS